MIGNSSVWGFAAVLSVCKDVFVNCSLHVANVVQMMHMIMVHGGLLRRKVFDDLMTLACYIAAAIHDYEHGGVNNDFLIQTRDKLAVTYNDISPLENHHLAAAARLMGDPRYRFTDVRSRCCCCCCCCYCCCCRSLGSCDNTCCLSHLSIPTVYHA